MKGISLIETLIVIGVFAVLGILSTSAVLLSLKGSNKGESQIKIRENLDYAVSVIERQLINASSVTSCTSTSVLYQDSLGAGGSFSCTGDYIASGSARLTSDEISVSACSFSCTAGTASNPPKVAIDVQAGNVSISTEINLRTY